MRRSIELMLAATVAAMVGCAAPEPADTTDESGDDLAADRVGGAVDPLRLPTTIVTFENQNGWGNHHIEWHTERRWDLLDSSSVAWAKRQGWIRATLQEGTAGNGLEFLAMHRVMIRQLREQFPKSVALFVGWETPPTDPKDKADPLPHGATDPFDDHMLDAISTLETKLAGFKSDDDLGRYLETALRPTASNASARATDLAAGLHNYIHNRFSDSSSAIDIGDPTVNLANKRFWRLHGWIDATWTKFRAAKGLTESDPAYQAALQAAAMHLAHSSALKATAGAPDPIPDSIRHPWAND